MDILLVYHISLKPAIQLLAFRQTKPRYFFLKEYPIPSFRQLSMLLVLFSYQSSQLNVVFSLLLTREVSGELSVKLNNFFLSSFMGRKKFKKPTNPYKILLKKAYRVLIFSTVYTILASRPIPTQFEKTFLMELYYLQYYLQSLISQIFPFLQVSMQTSHMSYLEIPALIHFFTCDQKFSILKSKFSAGHPIVLQKSFPVPMGMTPNAHLMRSTQDLASSLSTQLMVPSPPQMMTLATILSVRMASLRFYIQLVRFS